jgi:carboxyl-terminal processing protease
MKLKYFVAMMLFVVVGAIAGGIFGRIPGRTTSSGISSKSISAEYSEALDVVRENHVSTVDYEKVSESSIQGMLWSLDPHSAYFTREEFKKLYEDQQSRFFGIGVSIFQHRDGVYVQSVVKGTPAEKAGLKYGDRFVEVNGKDAKEWTSQEVSKNVRGERGVPVNIKIERLGADKPISLDIVRDGVPLPSIRNYFILKGDVGYIGLTGGFQETTAEELDQAINELSKKGMKQLVLDLRGNPGGLLPQAVEVVSRFVSRGQVVVSVKGRSRYAKSEDLRALGGANEEMPIVVMINGGSASASEIVAGAIQDYGRGIIVGSESFGKGLVQRVFYLPSGTGLTLTTARYYTPFGRSLQRDYSSGSLYDYYTHQNAANTNAAEKPEADAEPKPQGSPVETAGGRVFYGGRGIEPDLKVSPLPFNQLRYRINEAAFAFTRNLVAGKVAGFEGMKVEKQDLDHVLQPNEVVVSDSLYNAFLAFISREKEIGLTPDNLKEQSTYAMNRLKQEIATANYSVEAGAQVFLEIDPQVLKAIDALPEARKLAQSNREKPMASLFN